MTPTKLLIGQVLVVFAIMVLGLWAATQWAASMLGYQPELGSPWFELCGLPLYRPWALFGWWPMTKGSMLMLAAAVSLCACGEAAAADRPPQAGQLAARLLEPAHSPAGIAAPRPALGPRSAGRRTGSIRAPVSGEPAVLAVPEPAFHPGPVQVYPWSEGAVFYLLAAPGQVSDIALQPGEALVSVAAGDTVRWIVGDTSSGSGTARRTHILVKPAAAGLRTNLVIATDRRVYHVDAESGVRSPLVGISWIYPDDALLALRGPAPAANEVVSAAVAVDGLNFDYRIEGDRPHWRPLRAFDDGRQLFIQFPPDLGEGEAPPLFVTGDGGRAELVNYRIRGRYYVVDRLFAAAELRLGGKDQQVVRIVRGAPAQRTRSGS